MLSALVKDNTRTVVQQTQQQVHGFQQQLQPQHAAAIRQSQQVCRFVVTCQWYPSSHIDVVIAVHF